MNVLPPRMNVIIRPSGETAGEVAESGKSVIRSHTAEVGGAPFQKEANASSTASSPTVAAPAQTYPRLRGVVATVCLAESFPDASCAAIARRSTSRSSRC
jgi:hypothetical protein